MNVGIVLKTFQLLSRTELIQDFLDFRLNSKQSIVPEVNGEDFEGRSTIKSKQFATSSREESSSNFHPRSTYTDARFQRQRSRVRTSLPRSGFSKEQEANLCVGVYKPARSVYVSMYVYVVRVYHESRLIPLHSTSFSRSILSFSNSVLFVGRRTRRSVRASVRTTQP